MPQRTVSYKTCFLMQNSENKRKFTLDLSSKGFNMGETSTYKPLERLKGKKQDYHQLLSCGFKSRRTYEAVQSLETSSFYRPEAYRFQMTISLAQTGNHIQITLKTKDSGKCSSLASSFREKIKWVEMNTDGHKQNKTVSITVVSPNLQYMCKPRQSKGHLLGGMCFSQRISGEEGPNRGPALARVLYLVPLSETILVTLTQEYF